MGAHVIEYSAGTEAHPFVLKNEQVFFKLMQPFLVKVGMATQEELDQLYEQMLLEMMQDTFRGVHMLFTVWGYKP